MSDDLTLFLEVPQQTPETYKPTNEDFLAAVFVELQENERPVVLSISGAITAKTRWGVGQGWVAGTPVNDGTLNWYFTLSTYLPSGGQFRRRKDQFHRAFGVCLDDVGTKAAPRERLEGCPPSYLIETSAGNHQAGYLFETPCSDLALVTALQDSLVKGGLCDPGAKGPSTRLGRLHDGVNGKYDPPYHCRLIEWHPERRYSIDAIIEGLELEPVEPAGTRNKTKTRSLAAAIDRNNDAGVYLPRPDENAVLTALRQRGLYKKPLGDGRHDVTCPWVQEHSGHIDQGSAYFEPSDLNTIGGFKCHHSHGDTKRMGALLEFLDVTFSEAKHKPTIRLAPGELHRVVDAAESELAAEGRHYQRGGLIVTVLTDPGTGETKINATTPNALMRSLSACATWERYDARSAGFVVTDPTPKYVNVLFDSESYHHLPVLRGIARQPYLRADGSLMTQSGYDASSGMFGAFDERAFKVAVEPSLAEAKDALSEMLDLLTEFSFSKPHDKAAALALMLTAVIRPSLSLAPMGHLKAPQISSGKSYLQGLIAAFAGPAKPSAYAFPTNEEECAKLLLSALLEAPPVVAFDNLTTDLIPFKTLCSALTEEFITGRVLGVSKTATVPTQTLILSSGNNVDPVRDMTRRTLTVTLDPQCETPATRQYKGDPQETVRSDRPRFVSLALTIIRAYLAADCPQTEAIKAMPALGSYGDWTRLVRKPLVWLEQPDPATAIFARMAEDPDREALGNLLHNWHGRFMGSPTPVRKLVEAVEFNRETALAEAVRDIAEERGVINRKRLGRWIARHQGRIVNGLKLERGTRGNGAETWCVVGLGVSGLSSGQTSESVTLTGDVI